MRGGRAVWSMLIGGLLLCLAAAPARAQFDPRVVLGQVIQQLQTGTPNPTWYGQPVWNLIAIQTGNSGRYPQLVQLGGVQQMSVNGQIPMPAGPVYQITVQHQRGTSNWLLGISNFSRRIEYLEANFTDGLAQGLPSGLPSGQPSGGLPGTAAPGPAASPSGGSAGGNPSPGRVPDNPGPPPVAQSGSEACKRFPNLC